MVALTKANENTPPAKGWDIPGAMVKGVVLDPGIVYTSADVLLFSATNTVGLVATASATGLAASLKALSIVQPKFLEKYPQVKKVVFDDRTPLRAGGLALLVVGGAAIATGAWLPAAASMLFAVANFRLAESISKKANNHQQVNPSPRLVRPKAVELATVFIKRPEFYLNAGFACAGMMAGGASLFILPVVAVAFGIGINNAIKEKPEYAGHPKIITASAAAMFSAIGMANGHGLIAAAHAINAGTLVEMERRVTPGGMVQIVKDMASSFGRLITGKKKPAPQKPQPAPDLKAVQPDVQPQVKVETAPQPKQISYTFTDLSAPQLPANTNQDINLTSWHPAQKLQVQEAVMKAAASPLGLDLKKVKQDLLEAFNTAGAKPDAVANEDAIDSTLKVYFAKSAHMPREITFEAVVNSIKAQNCDRDVTREKVREILDHHRKFG